MSRSIQPSQFVATAGLLTGGDCCRIASALQVAPAMGFWSQFYQLAYQAAVERVAAEDRKRRLLGHAAPSIN